MFALLAALSLSWNDQTMSMSTEIMLRNQGDPVIEVLERAHNVIAEGYTRLAMIGAFLNFVEREPFNVDVFKQWRLVQTPFNRTSFEFAPHHNDDNLTTGAAVVEGLLRGDIKDGWTYNFEVKIVCSMILEMFSPIHCIELFDEEHFPNGDNSGADFFVLFEGNNVSLRWFWDTGCGRYTREGPFSDEDWKVVDEDVLKLMKKHPARDFATNGLKLRSVVEESYDLAKQVVYTEGLQPGSVIDEAYVEQCERVVDARLAEAGYVMAQTFARMKLPKVDGEEAMEGMKPRESMAWLMMCFLVPIVGVLVYTFCVRKMKLE